MLNRILSWRLSTLPFLRPTQDRPLANQRHAHIKPQGIGKNITDYIQQNRMPSSAFEFNRTENLCRPNGKQQLVEQQYRQDSLPFQAQPKNIHPVSAIESRQTPSRPQINVILPTQTVCQPNSSEHSSNNTTENASQNDSEDISIDPKALLLLAKSTQPSTQHGLLPMAVGSAYSKQTEAHQKALEKIMIASGPTRFGLNTKIAATLNAQNTSLDSTPNLISDHLPVAFNLTLNAQSHLKLVSWNLLSECHQHNSFLSISLSPTIANLCAKPDMHYFQSAGKKISKSWLLYDLAAELDHSALLRTQEDKHDFLRGTPKGQALLIQFFKNCYTHAKNATLKTNEHNQDHAITARTEARAEIAKNVLNAEAGATTTIDDETYCMMVSAFKLHQAIHGEHGTLNWQNRRRTLENNPLLLKALRQSDMLVLQECTDPSHFVKLLKTTEATKKFDAIIHKTNAKADNTDHCCIIYDSTRWQLEDAKRFGLNNNKKPAIVAKFSEKGEGIEKDTPNEDQSIIVGSIHYPGGHYEGPACKEISANLQTLLKSTSATEVPYIIAGDYNQMTSDLRSKLNEMPQKASVSAPQLGTMAGSDWSESCRGKTIDMAITNRPCTASLFPVHLLA